MKLWYICAIRLGSVTISFFSLSAVTVVTICFPVICCMNFFRFFIAFLSDIYICTLAAPRLDLWCSFACHHLSMASLVVGISALVFFLAVSISLSRSVCGVIGRGVLLMWVSVLVMASHVPMSWCILSHVSIVALCFSALVRVWVYFFFVPRCLYATFSDTSMKMSVSMSLAVSGACFFGICLISVLLFLSILSISCDMASSLSMVMLFISGPNSSSVLLIPLLSCGLCFSHKSPIWRVVVMIA